MKLKTPFLIGGAIAGWAGLSLAGSPAPSPVSVESSAPATVAAPASDLSAAQRRVLFNQRVQTMLATGAGSRLTDAPIRAPRSANTAMRPAAQTRLAAPSAKPALGGPAPEVERRPQVSSTVPTETASYTIRAALTRPTDAVECLTQAIYYEARSESEAGQAAVAEVVLNRAASGRYPRNVCDVVYQRNARTCQFSYTCDGSIGRTRINANSWARAERIARDVYAGRSQPLLPQRSVNYHANYVAPGWGRRLERVRQIGAHIFYGAALKGGTPGASNDGARVSPSRQLTFVRLDALDQAYADFRTAVEPTPPAPAPGTAEQ